MSVNPASPGSDGSRPFSLMLMICAVSDARIGVDVEPLLETMLSAWALADCPTFFHSDPADPTGFVSALVGSKTVHVPIHLAPLFPTQQHLELLVAHADDVRAVPDSTICLSGSQVFGVRSAADTDFCEYVLHTGRRLATSFVRLSAGRSSICALVRHGGNELRGSEIVPAVVNLCQTDAGHLGNECSCAPSTWKFDYLCDVPSAPVVITNLCVHEGDCEQYSWAYQEAAVTEAGQPLRQLVAPGQLGRYLVWLRDRIEEYRASNPVKALKRCLSLCAILHLSYRREIVDLLNSSQAVSRAAQDARRGIEELRSYLPQTVQDQVTLPTLDADHDPLTVDFESAVQRILERVLDEYGELLRLASECR